jgi:ribose-phosphate pyrophosphokinase
MVSALPELILGFADGGQGARDLAGALDIPFETIEVHRFPDDERRVRVPRSAARVAICRSLDNPNAKLIELLLAAAAVRDCGAGDVCLVAPYLPYMRQDIAFRTGEAVSQAVIGRVLASSFDRFVAVDPHLHRTLSLSQVFGGKPALALTAAPAIAERIGSANGQAIIIGPDEESAPLARAVAEPFGWPWLTARKQRFGDRDVRMVLPADAALASRRVIIVDDIITSGTTIVTLAGLAREAGAASVDAYVTHAMFDDAAAAAMTRAGVRSIVSCDGVPHPSNAVPLSALIARGLRSWR